MYVKDNMSTKLVTIDTNASVSEALDLMSNNGLHRLPVVDKSGRLLGLLTESIISLNTPNNATSLSVYELNYLLNKLKVADIMVKAGNVKTINPDALLEEAASIMREFKIGCLPVVEKDRVVGIITHNDIFDAFIELLGYHQKGYRYVVNVAEDKTGVIASITECFHKADTSISNVAVYKTDRGIEVVVIALCDDAEKCTVSLKDAGFNVTSVTKYNN